MTRADEIRQRLNPNQRSLTDVLAGGVQIEDSQLLVNQPDPESVWRHEESALVLGAAGFGVGILSVLLWRVR